MDRSIDLLLSTLVAGLLLGCGGGASEAHAPGEPAAPHAVDPVEGKGGAPRCVLVNQGGPLEFGAQVPAGWTVEQEGPGWPSFATSDGATVTVSAAEGACKDQRRWPGDPVPAAFGPAYHVALRSKDESKRPFILACAEHDARLLIVSVTPGPVADTDRRLRALTDTLADAFEGGGARCQRAGQGRTTSEDQPHP